MYEKIITLGELAALGEEWSSLADRHRNPPLRHEWFAAVAEAFADREQLSILVNRRAGPLVGIAPMSISQDAATKRLEILGVPSIREPSGLIYADAHALRELIAELLECGQPPPHLRVLAHHGRRPPAHRAAGDVALRAGAHSPLQPSRGGRAQAGRGVLRPAASPAGAARIGSRRVPGGVPSLLTRPKSRSRSTSKSP